MSIVYIPVCKACGIEDWDVKGLGWDSGELLRRLKCKACGQPMDPLAVEDK